jgi:CHAT domain-containing protein/tetratricopeptide (TPR) repeat protein
MVPSSRHRFPQAARRLTALSLLVFLGSGETATALGPEATGAEQQGARSLLAAGTPAQRAAILEGLTDAQISSLRAAVAGEAERLLGAAQPDAALQASEVALELAERLQERPAVVGALTLIGNARTYQGRHAEAEESLDKAARLAEEWNDREGQAWAWTQTALLAHWRGDYEKARDLCRAGLPILEKGGNKARTAGTLHQLSEAMIALGETRPVLDVLERSLRLYTEAGNEAGTAEPLRAKASVFLKMGDYARALHYYRAALEVSERHDDRLGVMAAFMQIGAVFRQQGEYTQALAHTEKALRMAEEMNLAPAIMNVSGHLGHTYLRMGDPARALEAFSRTLDLARRIGSKNAESWSLRDMGEAALQGGDLAGALERLRAGLRLAESLKDPSTVADVQATLAEALLRDGQADAALLAAEQAGRLAREIGSPGLYWRARWRVARIERVRGKIGEARAALDEAIRAIEELRLHAVGDEAQRGTFFENLVDPYYEAADLAEAAGDASAALSYAERAKARVLVDALRNGRPDLDESLSSEERAKREALRSSLRRLNRRIAGGSAADPARLEERETLRREYAAFEAGLYAARPELRLQYEELTAPTPEELTKLLPDAETAFVEFVVLDKRVLIFVITRGSGAGSPEITVHSRDAGRERLREQVRDFAAAVAGRDLDHATAARSLYDLLLKPLEARLRGRRHLVLVPDDVLWELPFAALSPDRRQFLIERHALSLAPSLGALREMERARAGRPGPRTLLAVGDPAQPASPAAQRPGLHRSVPRGALPEAAHEVSTLAKMYGTGHCTLLTGAAAKEAAVKRALPEHDVVHLATHGVFDDVSPLHSQVVLAPEDADTGEDGLLEAWEILSMKLEADLVVLSACQTARGRVGRGEGVMGMSWALLVAGCPTTVVSHWNVESRSTAQLMVAFHRALRAGTKAQPVSKAEALQTAQRKLLRRPAQTHPFYWAAFSVVGAAF